MKPVLEISDIWKRYKIGGKQERYLSLRESVTGIWKRKPKKETFWALREVNFEAFEGECIGIIGRNGAGKSTLLKILSRITPPTKGEIKSRGRVASLLEVGTGFHPELTGRENIYLNGSILGLRRTEINRKFDEIVAFSGVEKFLDTSLKHYSSGMQLRLAFSVAAHLEPEILLIDEVLAVGDAEFQKKCLGKMDEVSRSGRTILFVSHNLGAVKQLCSRGILLHQGVMAYKGDVESTILKYSESIMSATSIPAFDGPLSNKVVLRGVSINGKDLFRERMYFSPLEPMTFQVKLKIGQLRPFRVTLSIFKEGCRIFSLHDSKAEAAPEGEILSSYSINSGFLRPGLYTIAVGGLEYNESGDWFWNREVCHFSVLEEWSEEMESINHGLVNIQAATSRKSL